MCVRPQRANLTFTTKFFLFFFLHRLPPMSFNNTLRWDMVLLVSALLVGLLIDFEKLLITMIHESDFKAFTTYPFA